MLGLIRGHTKKIFWGLVAFVIPAFCLWGVGSTYLERQNNKTLGNVMGKRIGQRDLARQKEIVRRAMELEIADQIGDGSYSREWVRRYIEGQDLEQLAWQRILLLAYFERLGLSVSRRAVAAALDGMQMFRTGGVFDYGRYQEFLSQALHIEPVLFEEEVRDTLKTRVAAGMLTSLTWLSETELQDFARSRFEQIEVEAARVMASAQSLSADAENPAAVRAYFERNRESFALPVQRRMVYCTVAAAPADEAGVSDKDIGEYYTANAASFSEGGKTLPLEQVRDRVRKLLAESRAREQTRENARKVFYQLARVEGGLAQAAVPAGCEIRHTGLFAKDGSGELTKLFGEDASAVAREAFETTVNGIAAPLVLAGGVVILSPEEEVAAHAPGFDEIEARVRDQYRQGLQKQAAWERAGELARKLGDKLAVSGGDFKTRCGQDATVETLPPFSMKTAPAALGLSDADLLRLMAAPAGGVVGPVRTADGAIIFHVLGYHVVPDTDTAQAREKMAAQAALRKRLILLESTLTELATGTAAAGNPSR